MFREIVVFVILFNSYFVCVITSDLEENSFKYVQNKNSDLAEEKLVPVTTEKSNSLGRGHLRKQKKLLQLIYPLIVSIVAAKSIIVPLLFKTMSAISLFSFVMSKMALILSGVFLLRWMLISARAEEKTKFEIVQVPSKKYFGWNDRDMTGYIHPLNNPPYDLLDFDASKNKEFFVK